MPEWIECDNEAEHGAPHRTTDHGPSGQGDGPWLTSLVMWENCMRYVTDEPVTVAELEARAHRDQPGRDAALGVHHHRRDREEGPPRPPRPGRRAARHRRRAAAAGRGKVVRLTPAGLGAQRDYHLVAGSVEQRWHERYGGAIAAVRAALEPLAAPSGGGPPPLFEAIEPYPGNWRASLRRPDTLPHYPVVLHRGGYPDGS